ncbi:MAG TPA: hypothetical protein VMR41_04120 [Patescibacteria group bacterium]|nr:hypothetical protein [Patescibacteria group bacterium]
MAWLEIIKDKFSGRQAKSEAVEHGHVVGSYGLNRFSRKIDLMPETKKVNTLRFNQTFPSTDTGRKYDSRSLIDISIDPEQITLTSALPAKTQQAVEITIYDENSTEVATYVRQPDNTFKPISTPESQNISQSSIILNGGRVAVATEAFGFNFRLTPLMTDGVANQLQIETAMAPGSDKFGADGTSQLLVQFLS